MVYLSWVLGELFSDKNSYFCVVVLIKDLLYILLCEVLDSWFCRVCGCLGNIKIGFVFEILL